MPPLVSVIIPAYNAEKYLAEALESCLKQSHTEIEIIVVDDGSKDNTGAVAGRYPQVIFIQQANAGPSAARNRGIVAAKGQFLQFLDADDVLLPEKIAYCLAEFERHPTADIVYTDYALRTENLQQAAQNVIKPTIEVAQEKMLGQMLESAVPIFQLACALLRRSVITESKPFDERLIMAEDWHFWIKLLLRGAKFHYLPEALVWYRVTPDSLSKDAIWLARQRLKAYELLRELDIDVDAKIAGRHLALAVRLWEQNRNTEARQHFRLSATRGGRLLAVASYFLSAKQALRLLDWFQRLRKKR